MTVPCKACGAPVAWRKIQGNMYLPCNPSQVAFVPGDGNETFVSLDGKVRNGKSWVRWMPGQTEIGYQAHRVTCPFAERMRKRGKRGGRRRGRASAEGKGA